MICTNAVLSKISETQILTGEESSPLRCGLRRILPSG